MNEFEKWLKTATDEQIRRVEAGIGVMLRSPRCTDAGRIYCQGVLDAISIESGMREPVSSEYENMSIDEIMEDLES